MKGHDEEIETDQIPPVILWFKHLPLDECSRTGNHRTIDQRCSLQGTQRQSDQDDQWITSCSVF